VLNIAHRGASGTFPENTVSAFRAAIDAGADMCELDVQLTRDGAVVVIHDETVDRTTDGKGEVAALTLEEIKRLDAGAKFKARNLTANPFPRGKGDRSSESNLLPSGMGDRSLERIPTLDEVFAVTSGKCGLNIELKAGGLEHQVAQIMQARDAFNDSIVSSFDWEYLQKIQQLHFNIRIALLAEGKPVDLMMNAVAMRAHAINPRWDMVTPDLCKAAHERGLKVYTWTVDADARMRALAECGVDGIMTNYPERLRTVVGG
jgi:glycerophosphoryl diester phosphodiesterase